MPEAPAAPAPPVITPPEPPPTVTEAPPQVTAPPTTPLIAGKYKDAQAAENGDRELTKALGLPPLPEGPLFGPGRLYPDVLVMEAAIKQKETLFGKMKAPEKPETPPAPTLKPTQPIEFKPPEAPKPPVTPTADDLDPEGLLRKAGIPPAEIESHYNEHGRLSDAHYEKLKTTAEAEGMKLPRKFAESMAASMIVASQARQAEVHRIAVETVGDKPKLDALVDWANKKYAGQKEVLADLQRRVNNPALTAQAVSQLNYEYLADNGAAGSRPMVSGGAPAPSDSGPYTVRAEWEAVHEKMRAGSASPAEIARYNKTNPKIALQP